MPETNLFLLFTDRLEKAGISYMVTGSVAAMLYGEPRFTHDIDLVIKMSEDSLASFRDAFPDEEFYRPPNEVIREEIDRGIRGHFNLIHHTSGFKADVYLRGKELMHVWGMENRRRVPIEESAIWVAAPEYVILRKLEYYREGGSEKHLRDIAMMLKESADEIDLVDLGKRAELLGLARVWAKAAEFGVEKP